MVIDNLIIDIPSSKKNVFSRPIRNKIDCLSVLFESLRLLLSYDFVQERKCGTICFHVNKASRIVVSLDGKVYSINMPFTIGSEYDGFRISAHNIEFIDQKVVSGFIAAIKDLEKIGASFYYDANDVFDLISEIDIEGFDSLFYSMLMLDDGYFRYDIDPERADKDFHPLYHLDFFYSSSASLKIGLNHDLCLKRIIKIFNPLDKCSYLSKV